MKILTSLICTLILYHTALAQVPDKAEDISPLLIGEVIPSTEVQDVDGTKIDILEVVKKRPTVLLFYRGGWCPYCNVHLAAIGKVEKEILDLGYQLIGVAPDAKGQIDKTIEKNEVKYKVYSDASGDFMKAMGIAFQAPDRYGKMLDTYSGGENLGFLPVPSVFVVDKEGTILFEYISPNYKERMTSELLLGVLQHLSVTE